MISPFQTIAGQENSRILVVCDHASAVIPPSLGTLGVAEEALSSHVAWDIGAAKVTTLLAGRWRAEAVLAGVSRLVVDCNRAPGSQGWMPAETCGIQVPGNRDLAPDAVAARTRDWYDPYHRAIADRSARMTRPAIIAIHSFTPVMNDSRRPWHVGVLWNRDGRLAIPAMEGFRKLDGVEVGDNLPYTGQLFNYTLDRHADAAGLPHLSIEIRQDLIEDDVGAALWADKVFSVMTPIFHHMGL